MKYYTNQYRIIGDVAYGTTRCGKEYIVDAENVDWLQNNYSCYYIKHDDGIVARDRSTGVQCSLGKIILGVSVGDKRKVTRFDSSKLDYRRGNLWVGNKYILRDGYYEVLCKNRKSFLIDFDDYDLVSKYTWYVDTNGYVISERMNNGKPIKQHRLIMGIVDKPELEVDHIYHNTCDNRKANLRIVGRSENMHNVRRSLTSPNGCPGVELVKGYTDMWKVSITINGVRKYLGCYRNIEKAIQVRLDAEKQYGVLRTE